jgi:hypothetical protein
MGGHGRIRYAKDVYWPAGGHYAYTRSGPKWFIIGMTSCFLLSASVCYFSSLFERREVEPLTDSPYPFLSKRWARQYKEEREGK